MIPSVDLAQLAGVWSIEESRFAAIQSVLKGMTPAAYAAALGALNPPVQQATRRAAVAVIDIEGIMLKRPFFLFPTASTARVRDLVRVAAADPDIAAIVLRVDSPGGSVAGVSDLAAEVFKTRQTKPIFGFIEDLCASAAFEVASQCTKLFANTEAAIVGSIGTRYLFYDYSKQFEREGVEAVPIDTGPHKSAGALGTVFTAEQRAVYQSVVDSAQRQFDAAVMRGRRLSPKQMDAVKSGRIWTAEDTLSLRLGLIDGIKTFEEVIAMAGQSGVKLQPLVTAKPLEPVALESAFYSRRLSPQDRRRVGLS